MRSVIYSTLGGIALICTTTAAPASQKPCRDAQGKIIPCAKPRSPAPPRCKDDRGRFACKPAPAPHA